MQVTRVVVAAALFCSAMGCGSPTAPATPVAPRASATVVAASSSLDTSLPDLFEGLAFAMDLPGWLGGGPARWDAQLRSLRESGARPDKLAILSGFDAPIVGARLFAIDADSDLAVFVDAVDLPEELSASFSSDESFLSAVGDATAAAAAQDGQIVEQPVIERVNSPLGGMAVRIRYATNSLDEAGTEFTEGRIGYLFRRDDVGYTLLFTFPVSDNRYVDVDELVATFTVGTAD